MAFAGASRSNASCERFIVTTPSTPGSTPNAEPVDREVAVKALRTLAMALMGAVVMIGFALLSVGMVDPWEANPIAVVFLAVGLGVHMLVNSVIWPMIPAIDPGQDADTTFATALATLQPNMILRFALIEAPMMASVATAFVVPSGGLTIFVVAAIASLVLMWLHVYPNESVIRRTQERLEATGARTGLAEAFGFNAHP